jgi:hypothetical protein
VENVEIPFSACSSCAGDYEDPDPQRLEPDVTTAMAQGPGGKGTLMSKEADAAGMR